MDYITLLIIALGLSVDSFAISVSCGIMLQEIKLKQSLKIAGFLSVFQGLMPVLGWFAGMSFKSLIQSYDHWVAFGLLLAVGMKMIIDSFRKKSNKKLDPTNTLVLIGFSVATTIDALIVGISFGLLGTSIISASLIIFLVTFIMSMTGLYLGCRFCKLINYKLDVIAGIVLISIGTKILIEHTWM
ncbi:MAG: hypothetical protein A2046_14310 [Bacteroidetes bacterium GWA2_30_7]|nr:MAG: hypothetical protein A2046_14310 [Bacteroidetes bacterium GWA2_30_7]